MVIVTTQLGSLVDSFVLKKSVKISSHSQVLEKIVMTMTISEKVSHSQNHSLITDFFDYFHLGP